MYISKICEGQEASKSKTWFKGLLVQLKNQCYFSFALQGFLIILSLTNLADTLQYYIARLFTFHVIIEEGV
jgi:hypothetical protein